jgi:hypothetical protein
MARILFIVCTVLFGIQSGMTQIISVKIIDLKSGESIPFANIKVNETESLISNAEGYFTVSESNSGDETVLIVSYLGYLTRRITMSEVKKQQNIIKLQMGAFEIENVDVSNIKPNPYSIMAAVKKNLVRNYKSNGEPSKDMLFYRDVTSFKAAKFDVEITKSSGYTKKALKTANTELKTFASLFTKQPQQQFIDVLCNYYTATKKVNDKSIFSPKLEVVKATKLKDENRSTSLEDMEQTAGKILLQHLDTTKFYRIKSGLFGSRDTISLRKDYNNKKNKVKKNELTSSKSNLMMILSRNNFLQSEKLEFVSHPELYEYTYEGAIFSAANEFAYILKFKPKKSKAKYTGKLYVSETDYAVLRADYTLAEGETEGGFNMKFLLGVKASENVSKGTLIFKQNQNGNGYYLQYASNETGQYFYVNRPLKFIELTQEEKDVVALDLTVEGNSTRKTEFLNISRNAITEATYENVKEENFKYIPLKRYDPAIWKNLSAIEPLEEMKEFRAVD